MNLRNWMFYCVIALFAVSFIACSEDDEPQPEQNGEEQNDNGNEETGPIEVFGTWTADSVYTITRSIIIPEGQSLTIEAGTQVIIDGDGGFGTSPEINVRGSLYCYGTENDRILISVPEERRTQANIFAGLWGGIIGTETTQDMVFEYTDIEFAGALAEPGQTIVEEGELDEGEPKYTVYMVNPEGNFIMWHSRIAYSKDDAVRLNGAKTLVANCTFEFIGENGGEALNTKSGTVGDFAFNLFYSVATNGLKAANSKGREPQCNNNYYNNTYIACGWRRAQSGRGGSLNYENGARGEAFNNLIVNSRFGLRLRGDNIPDMENVKFGHSFYYGEEQEIIDGFYPEDDLVGNEGSEGVAIPESDIAGGIGENDPLFANYTLGNGFDIAAARNGSDVRYIQANVADFKLQSGSPALGKGFDGFDPIFATYEVNGRTYETPRPKDFIGAFGTN